MISFFQSCQELNTDWYKAFICEWYIVFHFQYSCTPSKYIDSNVSSYLTTNDLLIIQFIYKNCTHAFMIKLENILQMVFSHRLISFSQLITQNIKIKVIAPSSSEKIAKQKKRNFFSQKISIEFLGNKLILVSSLLTVSLVLEKHWITGSLNNYIHKKQSNFTLWFKKRN